MKKITMILLFVCGAFTVSMAQTTSAPANTTVTSKQDKAALAAQKKADKQAKALEKKEAKASNQASTNASAATSGTSTAHLNKNGTPDKRFKGNKQPTTVNPPTQAQATVPTQAPPSSSISTNKTNNHIASASTTKVADKSIGTDSKGRTIYQGPRGGKYYLTQNGHKEYVK